MGQKSCRCETEAKIDICHGWQNKERLPWRPKHLLVAKHHLKIVYAVVESQTASLQASSTSKKKNTLSGKQKRKGRDKIHKIKYNTI